MSSAATPGPLPVIRRPRVTCAQYRAAGASMADSSTPPAYLAARRSAAAGSVSEPTTAKASSLVARVRSAT